MVTFDALQRPSVADPPKDNGMVQVEVPNDKFIVKSKNSQTPKGDEKAEECGADNLMSLLDIAKQDKKYQKLIKIVQKDRLRKKEMPRKLKDYWMSLNPL